MTKTSSHKGQEKFDKKVKKAQAYLQANGFNSSTKTLFQDMERCKKKISII